MTRFFVLLIMAGFITSCRSTKKIQTAISKKDTVITVKVPTSIHNNHDTAAYKNDTIQKIQNIIAGINANHINFQTFTAKVNVDYRGSDGKNYNVNAFIRMYKDSAIWIMANAILGIEAMRVLITKDSVKLLDKLNRTYTERSVNYLQEVTSLPLDLVTLQDLIIGNPVFFDSTILSYSEGNNKISLLSIGRWFKNLLTLNEANKIIVHCKLDDVNNSRNRTADLTYNNYENKKGVLFSTRRQITVTEKNRLDIRLDFRQYDFNKEVSFPFPIPKNYDRN